MFFGTALFAAVAVLDWATSNALSLAAFYLFPILLVAWNCGRGWGLVFAVGSVATAFAQSTLQGSSYVKPIHLYIAYTNVLLEYVIAVLLTGMLRKLYNQERFTARIDALTGARNRKGFQEALASEIARHERKGITFCLAYIDCDNFKQVNDNYGHAEGDRVLKAIAEVALETLRRSDTVSRIGGDEFAVMLPGASRLDAEGVMRRLGEAVASSVPPGGDPIEASFGIAVFEPGDDPERVVARADRALYQAKRGRAQSVA